jgi:hypothetical protein
MGAGYFGIALGKFYQPNGGANGKSRRPNLHECGDLPQGRLYGRYAPDCVLGILLEIDVA